MGKLDRKGMVLNNHSQIIDGQRYAIDKIFFSLEIATVAISAHGLHDTDEHIAPEMLSEILFVNWTF